MRIAGAEPLGYPEWGTVESPPTLPVALEGGQD